MIGAPLRKEWQDLLIRPYACQLAPCDQWAEALLDGEPFCLDCADLILERVSIPRRYRKGLPDLADRVPGI